MSAIQSQIIASGLDVSALNMIKYAQANDSDLSMLAAFITGGGAYLALGNSIKATSMATSNVNWNIISSILGVITGVIIWKEDIGEA